MKTLLVTALLCLHPIASQLAANPPPPHPATTSSSSVAPVHVAAAASIPISKTMTNQGPGPLTGAAATRTRTRIFVLGGQGAQINNAGGSLGTISNGFYSLDLTRPWSTDHPAWSRHAPGPALWRSSICSSADGSRIVAFANSNSGGGGGGGNGDTSNTNANSAMGQQTIAVYSTAMDAWHPAAGGAQVNPHHLTEVRCVTSKEDDRVYVAGGLADGQAMTMDVFSFATESLSSIDMPKLGMMAGRVSYAAVWLAIRSSIVYLGGYTHRGFMPSSLIEYSPKENDWKETLQNTAGGPTSLVDHCVAADDKGTKVFIYGGRSQWNGPAQGTFYIYDVGLQTWTQGPSIGRRVYASCASVGDYFLLFGGSEDPVTELPADMGRDTLAVHIYKISANAWVNDFVPGSTVPSSQGSPASGNSNNNNNNSNVGEDDSGIRISTNVGLIVGAVGAGIIVLGAMVTVYFYLRSRDKRRIKQQQQHDQSRRPSMSHHTSFASTLARAEPLGNKDFV